MSEVKHKQGCDALGGYGSGVGPCSCGAQPAITSESGNQAAQGASAITSVPVLTDEEIQTVWVEHGLDDCAVEDFARAIESMVRSKLGAGVPMTPEQVKGAVKDAGYDLVSPVVCAAFINGLRYAEDFHGIVGKEGA